MVLDVARPMHILSGFIEKKALNTLSDAPIEGVSRKALTTPATQFAKRPTAGGRDIRVCGIRNHVRVPFGRRIA